MADTLQFVDSIDAAPTVRLDLNDDAKWGLPYDGFNFEPPPLKRAVVSTLLTDGESIPASAYGNRRLRMRLELKDSTIDGAFAEIQKLAREVDRETNILKWKPGGTHPVFFRTFRSDLGQIVEVPGAGTFRTFDVELLAEPFALGLRESLTLVAVDNDPAAASNPCRWDIAAPKGDVETPMIAKVERAAVFGGQSVIAVRRRDTVSATPFLQQAEGMTAGTDTALLANDPVFSGAGQNSMRCTFATTSAWALRLTMNPYPASASVSARGQYRVFARVRKNTATDDVEVLLSYGSGAVVVNGDAVVLPDTTSPVVVDLGLMSIPVGLDPVYDGASGTKLAAVGVFLGLQARRTAGAGTLDIDYLLTVPADDRLAIITWPNSGLVIDKYVIDAGADMVYGINASGQVLSTDAGSFVGGLPVLSPSVTNRMFFVREVEPGSTDAIPDQTDFEVAYFPRYLYVRPAST